MSKTIKPLTGKFGDFSGIVLKAAASGNLTAVKHYLSVHSEWLNQSGPHGRTLLWEAAYKGRTDVVAWLIERGADVHAIGSYYTPMRVELSAIAAARSAGHRSTVKLLKDHGAKDDFYAACHRGDTVTMTSYIKQKPSIVNRPLVDAPHHHRMGYHPIHYAVVGGQIEAVQLLIENGAQIAPYIVLLMDWCETNRSEILPAIKNRAESELPGCTRRKRSKTGVAEIDQPDWLGFPPLVDACRGNHNAPDNPNRVRRLLDRGAKVNVFDHKGKTALHRAAQAGFLKVTQLLIDNGADLEFADDNGETPIFDAARYGRSNTLKLLIESGANKEHVNCRGETPLFASAKSNHLDTFSTLLDAGVNRDHKNNRGLSVQNLLVKTRSKNQNRTAMIHLLSKQQYRHVKKKK